MAERGRSGKHRKDGETKKDKKGNKNSKYRKEKTSVFTLVRDHRTSDSVLGHVGRLTYISPEDGAASQKRDASAHASVGSLVSNRETGKSHSWRQIKPFEQWHSPLTSEVSRGYGESSVNPRHYITWLLKGAPEALEGIAGPPYDDVIEDMKEAENLKKPQTRLPLLAHGNITDTRVDTRRECRVLAMATGESGHALRVVRVSPQDWAWAASGNVTLALDKIDIQDEGYWCGNAVAINQIKFAVDNPAKPMSRWLIAQKSAETLIFEPTLGRSPILKDALACPNTDSQGLSFISMDLKIRIPMSDTGGRMHCDMAFNPATGTQPPQLAIVDDGGNWSVWNILGDRHMRKTTLSTVLFAQGNLAEGRDPSLFSITVPGLGHLNRIAWLPSSLGEQSKTLLLGNATAVNIVDIDNKEKPMLTLNTVYTGSLDVIIDVQISPCNPSHVFVLTTTAIFWFDLSHTKAQRGTSKPKHAQPLLLLSCPHLRNQTDRTLKLCLVPARSGPKSRQAVVALVYSMKQPEAVLFRFPDTNTGQEPKFEQEAVRFRYACDDYYSSHHSIRKKGKYNGQQTILVLPREPCLNATSKLAVENFGREYVDNGVDFFQVIVLRPDLSLQWSLYSCSPPHADGPVATPFLKTKMVKRDPRRKQVRKKDEVISYFGSRFAVPDGFVDEMITEEPKQALATPLPVPEPFYGYRKSLAVSDTEAPKVWRAPRRRVQVYNMARLFNMLDGRLEEVSVDAFEATDVPRDDSPIPSPLDTIRHIIGIANQYGSFAYTTLLNISNLEYLKEFGAEHTALSWTTAVSDLGDLEEQRVSIFNGLQVDQIGQEAGNKDFTTLYEVIGRLCSVSLARDDRERFSDDPFVRRQGLVAYVAVRLFFSQISMVVMPRQIANSASARTTPATTPGLEEAQSTLPTPLSASDMRMQSRYRDTILSSSPTKPSVPNWLMSSQEYGVPGPDSPGLGGDDDDYVLPSRELDDLQGVDTPRDIGTPRNETENGDDDLGLDEEDPVVSRLRQFAKSIKAAPPLPEGELRLITHWELGTDPEQFSWVPLGAAGEAEEELRRQAQQAREKKQRKLEKKAQRDRERLLSMGAGGSSRAQSAAFLPSSQAMSQLPIQMPSHFQTQPHTQTQASPAIMSSQLFSSQVMPSSQPVIHSGGAFGPRLKKKKKKKPATARGFK